MMPRSPRTHVPMPRVTARHGDVDNQSTRTLNTGSKAWRTLRSLVLRRDRYTCRDCGRFGNEVDHDDGDDSNNDEANLVTRCKRCHAQKTVRQDGGFGNKRKGRS